MATASRFTRQRVIRLVISLLIITHLLAVVIPPLAFQARGPLGLSPVIATAFRPIEAYTQVLYLDRGYAFFAPDPGPSHLIQAAIGTEPERTERIFPDRQEQWPRLMYHRHFMISEYLESIYEPPGPPPELAQLDPLLAQEWSRRRARYEHVRQSIVNHLRHEYPGREVAIRRIEHLIPNLADYREQPISLTDERLYQVLLDDPIDLGLSDELTAPELEPEAIAPPRGQVVPEGPPSGDGELSSEPAGSAP